MKSIIKRTVFLLLLILGFNACNDDFLNRTPLDSLTSENYWTTEDQVKLALNSCYSVMKGRTTVDYEQLSDNNLWPWVENYRQIASGNFTSDLAIINTEYSKDYDGIAKCNDFLANYQKVNTISEDLSRQYAAEARFIRAYLYFYLSNFFGDVQLVTKPLNTNDPEVYGSRQTKAEVVQYILDELAAIAPDLPRTISTKDAGRISQGAALALRARVALYNEDYAEAEASAKAVMDMGVYELYNNGSSDSSYNELFRYAGRASRNSKNKETILATVFAENISTHNLSREIWVPDEYSRWCPTQTLIDSYLCKDGLPIDKSSLYRETSYAALFENRDPRMRQTILAPGTHWTGGVDGSPVNESGVFNLPKFKTDSRGSVTITGYYFNKYVEPATVLTGNADENDVIILRYGEVLLNYAEALMEQGKLTQAVLDVSINLLRSRVGMTPMKLSSLSANGLDLRKEVRRERRVELAMEGLRYFDLMRWKEGQTMAKDVIGIPVSLIPTAQLPSGIKQDVEGHLIVEQGRSFVEPKNYLWPIPLLQYQRNANLGQNPGW